MAKALKQNHVVILSPYLRPMIYATGDSKSGIKVAANKKNACAIMNILSPHAPQFFDINLFI